MIKLWLHTVTLSFLKCFIPSACYRLCNIRLLSLSLSPQTDLLSSVTSTEKTHKAELLCLCTVIAKP